MSVGLQEPKNVNPNSDTSLIFKDFRRFSIPSFLLLLTDKGNYDLESREVGVHCADLSLPFDFFYGLLWRANCQIKIIEYFFI